MSDTAIYVQGVSKLYRLGQREPYKAFRDVLASALKAPFRRLSASAYLSPMNGQRQAAAEEWIWALKEVSFEVKQGEVVGVIGRNGAGKSTLLKILSRITEPTEGFARIRGRVGSLLEVGTGFHPELTGRENIFLNGAILGMKRTEIGRKFDEIVAFAETEKFIDTPVKHYSSGMYMRLAFAVAAHLEPENLIVDEVLAVGDAAFQKKCLGKMSDVAQEGRTVLFVSHNMNAIQRLCSRTMMLERGQLTAYGNTAEIVGGYLDSGANEAAPDSWIDVSEVSRRGSGQVRVSAVRYSSNNATLNGRPYSNGPLELTLSLVSDSARDIGSMAVILFDKSGTKLVNADTVSLGQSVSLREGENLVRVRIHQLYLNPGVYVFGWWLSNPLGGVFDFVETGFDIEVAGAESERYGTRPRYDGVVLCNFDVSPI